jgi:hypothetical protein
MVLLLGLTTEVPKHDPRSLDYPVVRFLRTASIIAGANRRPERAFQR